MASVIKMIEDEQPCVNIAQQLHAVEKAVLQAKRTLIQDHIDHCLDDALVGDGETPVTAEFKAITKYLQGASTLSVLADHTYRHLFLAQVVAMLGTGLATIALGLLAYDLSGERTGLVLGTIFTIKMVAYVCIAPIAGAFANRWPRRAMLANLDLIRAAVALCLPFVSKVCFQLTAMHVSSSKPSDESIF